MRPGKFSESVLKRSVLKQIKTKREEVNRGAEVGEDCALFSFEKKEGTLLTTAPIIVEEVESIGFQLAAIVNNVAAAGGEPVGIMVSSILPDKILESVVQRLSGELERACHQLNLQIAGGNTVITAAVTKPVLNITVIGKKDVAKHQNFHKYQAGQVVFVVHIFANGLITVKYLIFNGECSLRIHIPDVASCGGGLLNGISAIGEVRQ